MRHFLRGFRYSRYSRYLNGTFIITIFQYIVVPFRVPRHARAVDRNTQLASFDAKLAATATTEEATFAIYETNFYVCDSREINHFLRYLSER